MKKQILFMCSLVALIVAFSSFAYSDYHSAKNLNFQKTGLWKDAHQEHEIIFKSLTTWLVQ